MLKRILRGAGGDALKYFPVRLVPALTSLITVPVFTHMVKPADYGNFYLVNSLTALAATIATGWLTSTVVRFYWAYEREGELDAYISTVLWSTVASLVGVALVMAAVLYGIPGLVSEGVRRLLPIGFAALGVNYLVQVLQQIMRAANRSTAYALLAVASNLLATAFGIYFVAQADMGSFGILLGVVLGNLILVPFGLQTARKEGSLAPSEFSRDALSEFARYGLPMIPAALSSWALVLSDRYIIKLSQTATDVGIYSVAYGLGDKIMNLIVMPLLMTMGPVMIMTFEKQGEKLAQQVQTQFTRYFLLATLPLLAGIAAVSSNFMEVFTSDAYAIAYTILPIVSASVLCNGLTQIAGNGLALHKKTPITMANTLIAAAFQVIVNFLLVPRFGYHAAAWTTLASYGLLLTLTWFRSRPYLEWKIPWNDVVRIAAAATGMALVVGLAFHHTAASLPMLALQAATGLAVYAILLLFVGEIRPDERAFATELAGRAWSKVRSRR